MTLLRIINTAVLLALVLVAEAQGDSLRTRTRQVDYAEYDRLTNSLGYAPDKLNASRRLLDLTGRLFTPEDEEYFQARVSTFSMFQSAGDFYTAIRLMEEAVAAFEGHFPFFHRGYSTVNRELALNGYIYLAGVYTSTGLYDKAVRLLESRREVLEAVGGSFLLSFYSAYAQALLGVERYDDAIPVALKLKELSEAGALDMNMAPADEIFKIDESWPEETKQTMRKAKLEYEKTRALAMEMSRSGQRMNYSQTLGSAYFGQYQFAEALPWLEQVQKEINTTREKSLNSMESSRQNMESSQLPDSVRKLMSDADEYLQKYYAVAGMAIQLIIASSKTGQMEKASPYATSLIDKALFSHLQGNLAASARLYEEAFREMEGFRKYAFIRDYVQAYVDAYSSFYVNLKISLADYSYAFEQSKRLIGREEESVKRNFRYLTESERKEFFRSYTRKLERYYSLLLLMTEHGQDKSEELLDKILQSKGLILDITREQEQALRSIKDPQTMRQVREIRVIREKLAGWYQALQKGQGGGLADSVRRYSLRLSDLEQNVNARLGPGAEILKSISWKQVQSSLKPKEVYVEVLRLPRDNFNYDKPSIQYWAFVVRPGAAKPTLFKFREGEAFDSRGLKYYQNMIRTQQADKFSYEMFWAQIGESIQGATTVALSPDGAYQMINPLTLKNPNSGKYLLSEIELKRVATGRDLLTSTPEVRPKSISMIGNPEFAMARATASNVSLVSRESEVLNDTQEGTRAGFADLPGTGREVALIEDLAISAGYMVTSFTGTQASESNVKNLKDPGVLHIATHGEFDLRSRADSYLRAKLILAGAADPEPFSLSDSKRYEDGLLTAFEVLQLELSQTGLVVLSACETGLGEVQSGEGVWGLQRAFQLAGARSVLGSLWKISDEATVTFMETFYRAYLAGEGLGLAYHKAMEASRKLNDHPYFWGAFILSGR